MRHFFCFMPYLKNRHTSDRAKANNAAATVYSSQG